MHRHRTSGRQPDLFPPPPPLAAVTGPAWSDLPDMTQRTLTVLMTRLLITRRRANIRDASRKVAGASACPTPSRSATGRCDLGNGPTRSASRP